MIVTTGRKETTDGSLKVNATFGAGNIKDAALPPTTSFQGTMCSQVIRRTTMSTFTHPFAIRLGSRSRRSKDIGCDAGTLGAEGLHPVGSNSMTCSPWAGLYLDETGAGLHPSAGTSPEVTGNDGQTLSPYSTKRL